MKEGINKAINENLSLKYVLMNARFLWRPSPLRLAWRTRRVQYACCQYPGCSALLSETLDPQPAVKYSGPLTQWSLAI